MYILKNQIWNIKDTLKIPVKKPFQWKKTQVLPEEGVKMGGKEKVHK